jgi:hypothetical protein
VTYAIAFILAILGAYRITLVGQLPVSELAIIFLSPVLFLFRGHLLKIRGVRPILVLGFIWLVSQMLSDFVNHSTPERYLRGWANAGMTLYVFAFWVMLLGSNMRAYLAMLAGGVVAGFLTIGLRTGGPYGIEGIAESKELWDMYILPWHRPAILLFMWLTYRRYPTLGSIACFASGAMAIATGGRSYGLIIIMVGALILYARWAARAGFKPRFTDALRLGLFVTPAMLITFWLYVYFGLQGVLGGNATQQLQANPSPYNPIMVIVSGRGEMLATIPAIIDKPILGHGSWAVGPEYHHKMLDTLEWLGFSVRRGIERPWIPAHSAILGAWVWAGLAGFVMWMYVLVVLFILLVFFMARPWSPVVPVVCFLVADAGWALIFSPLQGTRFYWPAPMAFCLIARHQMEYAESHMAAYMHQLRERWMAGEDDLQQA